MKKILINECFGGFGFSEEFVDHCTSIGLLPIDQYSENLRDNQAIVNEAIKFGLKRASGYCADLVVEAIDSRLEYSIHEYDGSEYIDQTWFNVTIEELKAGLSIEQIELAKKVSCIKIRS